MSFDLARSLRRIKPERQTGGLGRRPEEFLPFVPERPGGGADLLLDTCVYIDVLQDCAPPSVVRLLETRTANHSGIALAELTHLFGRLDPRDPRTESILGKISNVISRMPSHRLRVPSSAAMGDAGILAGLASRLVGVESGREQSLLNDAMIYMQAVEQGHMLLTRNIREFDWFDQLFPSSGRLLFYRRQ